MLQIITGLPGSGKTYYAVYLLYNNFLKNIDKKSQDKSHILKNITKAKTNINELKTDNFNNVENLDFDQLHMILSDLHQRKINDKYTDTQLIQYIKDNDFDCLNTIYIIDEAHNYFDKKDKVLIWWLAYHRHLYQDIILITQNLGVVDSKYKVFSEVFYRAVPTSLRVIKNRMRYGKFLGSRMTKADKAGVMNIPLKKEVFETYTSGASVQTSNIILKLVFMFIAVASLSFIGYKLLTRSSTPPQEIQKPQTYLKQPQKKDNSLSSTPVNPSKTNILKIITCSRSEDICLFDDEILPYKVYKHYSKTYDFEILNASLIPNTKFVNLHVLVNEDFLNLFSRSTHDEKNITNDTRSKSSFSIF